MRTLKKLVIASVALLSVLLMTTASASAADTIDWVDWTSATGGTLGVATGNIGAVAVGYSGEIFPAAQTSGGINYWIPGTPYLSPTVTNAPPDPDIIRLSGLSSTGVNQVTFSQPVKDPIMAIVSLGQPGVKVRYNFDAPFQVLSCGPGYWGGPGTLVGLPGNVLEGEEGHGVIQFQGTFTSISWTVSPYEYWHGFTLGRIKVLDIGIDIKPGSYPNSINIDSNGKGVVPVAILGSPTFDAATVDPLSVRLEGATVQLKGKSGNAGSLSDVNGDGYLDLVVQIADFAVLEGATTAKLTASTYSGQLLQGSDSIRLVPPSN